MADLTQTAADLIDAFNEADWERLRAVLSPDVVYAETGTGRRVESADAYVELCQGWKEALPDVRGTIRGAVAGEDTVAQELSGRARTGTDADAGWNPRGLRGADQRPGVALGPVRGRRGREMHHYLDVMTLLQQIGAIPAAPG